MANYRNPIDLPNPFLVTQPVVFVVRHVRIVPATGEVVAQTPYSLKRYLRRIDNTRVYPRSLVAPPINRDFPSEHGSKKKAFL